MRVGESVRLTKTLLVQLAIASTWTVIESSDGSSRAYCPELSVSTPHGPPEGETVASGTGRSDEASRTRP